MNKFYFENLREVLKPNYSDVDRDIIAKDSTKVGKNSAIRVNLDVTNFN